MNSDRSDFISVADPTRVTFVPVWDGTVLMIKQKTNLRNKFNKEFDNETENFLWLENSPPPHNFSNGPSLIQY